MVRRRIGMCALSVGLFLAGLPAPDARAHPRGFHKRVQGVVTEAGVDLLVTLELDSGRKAQELRRRGDANLDGMLSSEERDALKGTLAEQMLRPLAVSVGGRKLEPGSAEAKLSLRGDPRVNEKGVTVVVRVSAPFGGKLVPGMKLVLVDASPDDSHVGVEMQTQLGRDGGRSVRSERGQIEPGHAFEMTLRP